MARHIDPYLTKPDVLVLRNLIEDARHEDEAQEIDTDAKTANTRSGSLADEKSSLHAIDESTIELLKAFNNPTSEAFEPTIFTSWDDEHLPTWITSTILKPYASIAAKVARHPTDVVFVTHILIYLFINLPSAIWLFYSFTYTHAFAHAAFTFWCAGPYTLLLHNHIHNDGVLAKNWSWLDYIFPYLTEPLMGHTWNSYYYHHVKHHHAEGNGPDDLSSTIRYQRDDVLHFLHYYGRFLLFIWVELPLYFYRRDRVRLAVHSGLSEVISGAFLVCMTVWVSPRASLFVLVIPVMFLRLALMVGNWGQHALVDELEPDSNYRSSITLIDVPVSLSFPRAIYPLKYLAILTTSQSNRFCFNDGYHTSHHLNPKRHWREHPVHFVQSKKAYSEGRALVFHNIDYFMMTIKLLQKDYMHLAGCLIPLGEQTSMSLQELADMLRTKTKRFTEEEIEKKFKQPARRAK